MGTARQRLARTTFTPTGDGAGTKPHKVARRLCVCIRVSLKTMHACFVNTNPVKDS